MPLTRVETRTYRTREFATLAGVTVRALHHYDRLGLLKPQRTHAGYRVYSEDDLKSLEQIVALKFIGLPLKKIKVLRRGSVPELARALGAQRTILEEKRWLLEQAIGAIRDVEVALQTGSNADTGALKRIIEVIEMQNKSHDWKKKYDGLVQAKLERLKALSPEVKAELHKQWADLFNKIRGALAEDPASSRAQELANRWLKILEAIMGGAIDPGLLRTSGAVYGDPDKWPTSMAPFRDARVWEFVGKALATRH